MSDRDWTLTVRVGPQVEHSHHATLAAAADALTARLTELDKSASREEVRFFARRIEPVNQVVARLELTGPDGEHGGIDLRGDGSEEPFSGRWRRRVIERRRRESATEALARALSGRSRDA